MIKKLLFGIKREYWESKKMLITTPLIVTALFFLIAMVATWTHHSHDTVEGLGQTLTQANNDGTSTKDTGLEVGNEKFWFSGVYLAAAWLAGALYALSSLYSDRRDQSILYWKTMPVSELQTVLSKFLFSILGFSAFAIIISWISAIVLMIYATLMLPAELLAEDVAGMSFSKLVVWPVVAVFVAVLWCAPFFALLLCASARASRSPIFLLLVVLIVIRVIEQIFFGRSYVIDFLSAHSPFSLLSNFSEMDGVGEFLRAYIVTSFPRLILGVVVSSVLIWQAIRQRSRFFDVY